MTKHITVKLTVDQADWLKTLVDDFIDGRKTDLYKYEKLGQGDKHQVNFAKTDIAFSKRLGSRLEQAIDNHWLIAKNNI